MTSKMMLTSISLRVISADQTEVPVKCSINIADSGSHQAESDNNCKYDQTHDQRIFQYRLCLILFHRIPPAVFSALDFQDASQQQASESVLKAPCEEFPGEL